MPTPRFRAHPASSCLRAAPLALSLAALAALVAAPVAAQGGWDFGVRGGVYLDDSDPFVGVEGLTRIGSTPWMINPNAEIVFPDHGDLFTLNGDVHYDLAVDGNLSAWVGAGLALVLRDFDDDGRGPRHRDDDETDVGLNLLGGVGFLQDQTVRPYVQGKVLISDDSEAVIAVGVRF